MSTIRFTQVRAADGTVTRQLHIRLNKRERFDFIQSTKLRSLVPTMPDTVVDQVFVGWAVLGYRPSAEVLQQMADTLSAHGTPLEPHVIQHMATPDGAAILRELIGLPERFPWEQMEPRFVTTNREAH